MCTDPDWKREKIPDHKFDFIDTREFTDNGFGMRMKYLFLYAIVLKSFLVYVSDVFSAITMVTTHNWSNDIFNSCTLPDGCVAVDFNIGRWVFFGCVIFGFLLLAYEARKAKKIIQSRDISYAFTNVMANNYYSLRSYDHFCFFDHVSNSTKRQDDYAFFVFFTFKGWKRLLLADGPRQAINAITLYSFWLSKSTIPSNWYDPTKYFAHRTLVANALTCTIVFTVVVFGISLMMLVVAGICYIPLLCYIRGNLKEYCCHKIDKRIHEILQRKNKKRQQQAMAHAKKEAQGDFSHLKGKKGAMDGGALPLPTLPNVQLDDEEFDDGASFRTRGPPASTYTAAPSDFYGDKAYPASTYAYPANDYPAMPAYDQQQYGYYEQQHAQYEQQHAQYDQQHAQYADPQQHQHIDPTAAAAVYGEREPYFQDNYGSQATLPGHAEPYDHQRPHYAHGDSDLSTGEAYGTQDYPSPTSGGPPTRQQQQYAHMSYNGSSHVPHRSQGGLVAYAGGGGGGYAV